MLKKIFTLFIIINSTIYSFAQNDSKKLNVTYTADSLSSGNTKDVLTSFFQLAFNNLTGANREFNFSSNPYAVMLRSNPNLIKAEYYEKYKNLRRLNFNFGLKLDSNYKFSGFSSGIKWKAIDERDFTTSKKYTNGLRVSQYSKEVDVLWKELLDYADKTWGQIPDTDAKRKEKKEFLEELTKFINDKSVKYKNLKPNITNAITAITTSKNLTYLSKIFNENPDFNFVDYDKKLGDSLKDVIKNGQLLTLSFSDTTYNDKFAFSNLALTAEYSKGIIQSKAGINNIEANLKASCNFLQDTLQQSRNLQRILFNAEGGLNWVFRDRENQKSYFELKLTAAYYHNFTYLYLNEERSKFTLNGTARVRIYDDIWIPFEIKYDPANGNFLGFLSVKSNFTGLASLLKGK